MANEKLLQLAPDLTRVAPRSPRAPLGAYGVLAARMLDKCRAELAGKAGDYHFNCPMDQIFFKFTKIDPAALKEFIATGATTQKWHTGSNEIPRSRIRVKSRIGAPVSTESVYVLTRSGRLDSYPASAKQGLDVRRSRCSLKLYPRKQITSQHQQSCGQPNQNRKVSAETKMSDPSQRISQSIHPK